MDIKTKLEKYLNDNLSLDEEISSCSEEVLDDSSCERSSLMQAVGRKSSSFRFTTKLKGCASSINTYLDKEIDDNKFQKLLFEFIDKKGLKDSDVYNKANIDRRLFSKIRSNEDYHPSKETIIALASSLELSIDDLEKLLESASYSLPKNNKFDLIIRFCFNEKIYNILEINNLLLEHECQLI